MHLDNSGTGPLRVPGYGGVPVEYEFEDGRGYANATNGFKQSPAITARESAMLEAMNNVTEKTNWVNDVFDDTIATGWYAEARKRNKLISRKAWAWCLQELQDKATECRKTGFVQVLDAGSSVCKSDRILADGGPGAILRDLPIRSTRGEGSPVSTIVDPDQYPLVRGTSLVMAKAGQVDLSSFSPKDLERSPSSTDLVVGHLIALGLDGNNGDGYSENVNDDDEDDQWPDLQRLPCEVKFVSGDGYRRNDVEISSYINNLHPCHRSAYESIQRVISAAVPLWNACVIKRSHTAGNSTYDQTQQGRVPLRIVTYGARWRGGPSLSSVLEDNSIRERIRLYQWASRKVQDGQRVTKKFHNRNMTPEQLLYNLAWIGRLPVSTTSDESSSQATDLPLEWTHPEPGKAFTYEDWKIGKCTDRAVVKMIAQQHGNSSTIAGPTHTRYEVDLAQTYAKQGLQTIVQIVRIDLPDQIRRNWRGKWQIENQPDEHIVASAMYAYDVSNVDVKIQFRQETPMPHHLYRYEDDDTPDMCQMDSPSDFRWRNAGRLDELDALASTFGFKNGLDIDGSLPEARLRFQELGSVAMPQDRIITFPNTLERQLTVELRDGHSIGHFSYVMIHLVDPEYRICSTANVPPQQHDWWAHAYPDLFMEREFPREIVDNIMHLGGRWSMSEEEAEQYRENYREMREQWDEERHEAIGRYYF